MALQIGYLLLRKIHGYLGICEKLKLLFRQTSLTVKFSQTILNVSFYRGTVYRVVTKASYETKF